MMIEMATVHSDMMVASMHNGEMSHDNHHSDHSNLSGHCQIEASALCDSDEEHQYCAVCVAHCGTAALPSETVSIDHDYQQRFETFYHFRKTPHAYTRLLKPPKFV